MPDAIEWRPSSVAFFARGALHPFVTPLDLLRFRPLSPLARVRMGAAVLALQRFAGDRAPYERITARAWIERRMGAPGVGRGVGPAAAREVRRARGRDRDGLAVEQAAAAPLRRAARTCARSGSATRATRGRRCSARSSARSTAGGGRVLTDTPAARIERAGGGFRVVAGAPGSFRSGHDPRAFAPAGDAVYDRVLATVPNDVFAAAARPRAGRRGGGGYLARARVDRVLRRALPAARARPRLQPVLLDQRRRPRAARSSG